MAQKEVVLSGIVAGIGFALIGILEMFLQANAGNVPLTVLGIVIMVFGVAQIWLWARQYLSIRRKSK